MGVGSPILSTPGRNTKIVFDEFGPTLQQPLFAFDRRADQMAKGQVARQENVVYIPGIGFRLRSYNLDPWTLYETEPGQLGIYAGSEVTVAPYHDLSYMAAPMDLPGVSYSGVPEQAMPMYQKRPGNESFEQRLAADQTAFPGPETGSDPTDMDRVFVTNAPHTPDESLLFILYAPGTTLQTLGPLGSCYFTGPAGSDSDLVGFGQYCLKVFGEGMGVLFERGVLPSLEVGWARRIELRVHPGIPNQIVRIVIATNASESCITGYRGSRITMMTVAFPAVNNAQNSNVLSADRGLIDTMIQSAAASVSKQTFVYDVPRQSEEPVQVAPARIDIRRDCRAYFQLARSTFPASGILVDQPFSLPFYPDSTVPLILEWYADSPAGSDIDVRLFRADTGDEVAGEINFTDCLGGSKTFPVPEGRVNQYFVKFDFGSAGSVSSTLASYRVLRDAVIEIPGYATTSAPKREPGKALPQSVWSRVDITGPGEDPAEESAEIAIADLTAVDPQMSEKAGSPVAIKVYDDSDVLTTVLHRGIIARSSWTRIVSEDKQYPRKGSYALNVTCRGEWERAKRQLSPRRFELVDKAAGRPMKVTDAVFLLFTGMGYPAYMLDIPDLPIRIFGNGDDEYVVEPGTPLLDFVTQLVKDYLGAFLLYDPNAGTYGMWRLIQRKAAPYVSLARFVMEHPGAMKLPSILASYGSSEVDGREVPHIPIFSGRDIAPPRYTNEPAEGNIVVVHGGAAVGRSAGVQGPARYQQIAVNVASYNAFNLPTDHANYPQPGPNFLGEMVPIEVYDATLGSQAAVDWVCRRVFDYACFGRQYMNFIAPLALIWDEDDPYQERARPLRFLDPVQVKQPDGSWKQYVVVSVNPSYTRDGFMLAEYEIVTSTKIDEYAIPVGMMDPYSVTVSGRRTSSRRAMGIPKNAAQAITAQRRVSGRYGDLASLPEGISLPIQDLDPESPSFGQFYFMAGYDAA